MFLSFLILVKYLKGTNDTRSSGFWQDLTYKIRAFLFCTSLLKNRTTWADFIIRKNSERRESLFFPFKKSVTEIMVKTSPMTQQSPRLQQKMTDAKKAFTHQIMLCRKL